LTRILLNKASSAIENGDNEKQFSEQWQYGVHIPLEDFHELHYNILLNDYFLFPLGI
jgi:hypothetical protein